MRIVCLTILFLTTNGILRAESPDIDLAKIERKIRHEPKYQGQPHYALFLFGPHAEHKVWFVVDGDSVAYIDRNGNGDLTDPEDKVELDQQATARFGRTSSGYLKSMHIFPLGEVFGSSLNFHLWVRNLDFDMSGERPVIQKWYQEMSDKHWVNGSLYRVGKEKMHSQNPLLLTQTPEEAQISRFDGPLTFSLSRSDYTKLEDWPRKTQLSIHIGWENLLAKDCSSKGFALTSLATTDLPPEIHPEAVISYEDSTGKQHQERLVLNERCCGNQFYTSFRAPRNVASDTVKVLVQFPSDCNLASVPAQFDIPVNRGLSEHSDGMYVLFRNPELELKDAVNALRKSGLDVQIVGESLMIQGADEETVLGVILNRTPEAKELARGFSEDAPEKQSLADADAMFEVLFRNPEYWIEEKATLDQIRLSLLELTHGICFSTWDKQLTDRP